MRTALSTEYHGSPSEVAVGAVRRRVAITSPATIAATPVSAGGPRDEPVEGGGGGRRRGHGAPRYGSGARGGSPATGVRPRPAVEGVASRSAVLVQPVHGTGRTSCGRAPDALLGDPSRLRRAILAGTHAPGDALPSERQLSEELGASRHAVREALKRLQQAGLVHDQPGRRDARARLAPPRRPGPAARARRPTARRRPSSDCPARRSRCARASGADAARLCARARRPPPCAPSSSRAPPRWPPPSDRAARNAIYDVLWDRDRRGVGQRRLPAGAQHAARRAANAAFDAALVGAEIATRRGRTLVGAVADGDDDGAARRARAPARALRPQGVPEHPWPRSCTTRSRSSSCC